MIFWLFANVSNALAQCSNVGDVMTCTTSPGPISQTQPPISTLNVNNLTDNITAAGPGQAGVSLTSTRTTLGNPGGSAVEGDDGENGEAAGAININLVGPGVGFVLNAGDGIGIEARSVGGGGQRGGNGTGALVLPGLGGDGGNGGTGGNVFVGTTGSGTISTGGVAHHGILGLSQGGAGGRGGDGDTLFDIPLVGTVYGEGGDGGTGGSPGTVTISNTLNIGTSGNGSAGIWAQSVGARGGAGGEVSNAIVNFGGDGAPSSNGGTVLVTHSGAITTGGDEAFGIFAQSIGGFAGDGGGAYGIFSSAGSGASAGAGGVVTVETLASSSIITTGQQSYGIVAQSIGGGGGAGGTGAGIAGFGGAGGAGGFGQTVTVTNRANIDTDRNGATGIVAQSVGGGGGGGGTGAGVLALGGAGGGGGNGGTVVVDNIGAITTEGNGAEFEFGNYGIFAQSVGGGGGSAHAVGGLVALGASGGTAGAGFDVTVNNDGGISSLCTLGGCTFSGAIYAQSVGGGGGRGSGAGGLVAIGGAGGGGGDAGVVRVDNSGALVATGGFSRGIFAQSVGGGGGDGGFAGGLFALGLSGANGGDGRYVNVLNSGNIATNGENSAGIFAQSVGGGGGNGGSTVAAGVFGAAGFGGKGGGGGVGGNVDVNRHVDPASIASTTITTYGNHSAGILAQSIGGGGGNGGFAIAASGAPFFSAAVAFGGSGGSGGSGGDVYAGARGSITTNGSFSSGLIAESIGGGGGRGGFAISAAGSTGGAVSMSLGGTGAGGGTGGLVTVQNYANISANCDAGPNPTGCTQSNGILASSIGGGGGSGGFAIGGAGGLLAGATLNLGGDGGAGNFAQAVDVDNFGNIGTTGTFSNGIMAQSLGGGGGNGGFAISAAFTLSGASASLSFGGAGGGGSYADLVDVDSVGNITTQGDFSNGIFAQSIGGGGGTGGFAVSGSVSIEGVNTSIAFGGGGGIGSHGGVVNVDNTGNITTAGNFASAIFAQSIGGGGGTGGFSGAVGFSLDGTSTSLSFGGDGGAGSHGNDVTVRHHAGDIRTNGAQSAGIVAQSIGGGGGTAGFALSADVTLNNPSTAASLGGDGGNGGGAGKATVITDAGTITTAGVQSHGILAQSVAGGGGWGGFSVGASFSLNSTARANSIGGTGGTAKDANEVLVENSAVIDTGGTPIGTEQTGRGVNSHGILAQSIGGGGGTAGFAVAASMSIEGEANSSSTGGDGGVGGNGNTVRVKSDGAITTRADSSIGIFAQSVGGGGGAGGFAVGFGGSIKGDAGNDSVGGNGNAAGDGGKVFVDVLADITTYGALSHGVLAQSVGGGGGFGGFSIGVGASWEGNSNSKSVGGSGNGGGIGEDVHVTVGSATGTLGTPHIHTYGLGSAGVLAQSIGGGGGTGGFAGGLVLAPDGSAKNEVGGGNGGVASNGGAVKVDNYGRITTERDNAAGILAQSIGGSGGTGGFSISADYDTGGDGAKNSVGGQAGGGGNGGKVDVLNAGIIETNGSFSHGIFAQSVGGGGGNGGFSVAGSISDGGSGATGSVGGAGGEGGTGGSVTVKNTGSITVNGQNSAGVFAQSVGGGGGSGGIAGAFNFGGGGVDNVVGGAGAKGGSGGDVVVESSGSIRTVTANSTAVVAQSVGGGGGWGGLAIGIGDGGGDGSSGIKLGLGADCDITGDECDLLSLIPIDGARGKVTVTINGETTVTEGAQSFGMIAQSIAGGGGTALTTVAGLLGFSASDVVLGAGSNGSLNGDAQFSDNTYNTIDTSTAGIGSLGLVVQSIGGGGGVVGNVNAGLVLNPNELDNFILRAGGFSGGPGLNRTGSGGGFRLDAAGTVSTAEANAIGIVGQTIGGGGGIVNVTTTSVTNAGDLLDITVGGSQLTNFDVVNNATFRGDAGTASTLTAQALVSTEGALSHGIVAQSIGGGGGISNAVFENGVVFNSGVSVKIGSGDGGSGGTGGQLTVNANGVETAGNGAFGIVAQSIGGGGGLTGVSSGNFVLGQDGFSLTPVNITGGTGDGGDGGNLVVNARGNVRTDGYGAHGIVAQSIGGGGGIVGNGQFATAIADASEAGSFAGSIGNAGTSGTVAVTLSRNVAVHGAQSFGIFAQSAGGTQNNNISVEIDQTLSTGNGIGLVWAADGSGAAVRLADGLTNSLRSNGTLYAQGSLAGSGLPLLNGLAVLGGAGNDNVVTRQRSPAGANDSQLIDGTRTSNIIGDIDLGGGTNSILNEAGAQLISDTFIRLGAGNALDNDGYLSPGDRAGVKTTALTGDFAQSGTGVYYIDIDLNQQNTPNQVNDLFDISGTGEFDGEGPLLLMSINKAFADTGYVVARALGGVTDNGFDPTLYPPAVGFNFRAEVQNANTELVVVADKAPFIDLLQDPLSGTTDPNVWRMGEGIDTIEAAIDIDDPFNYLINLLRLQPDHKALGDAVVSLTPHQAPHLFEVAQRQSGAYLDRVTACPEGHGGQGFFDGRNCLWMQGAAGDYHRNVVLDSPINDDRWQAVSFGAQAAANSNFSLGLGGGITGTSSVQTRYGEYLSSFEGELYQASLSASYRNGGFGIDLVAAGAMGQWDTARHVQVDGFEQTYASFDGIRIDPVLGEVPVFSEKTIVFEGVNGIAASEATLYALNPRVRLSHESEINGLSVLGYVDIDGHIMHTPERIEDGVGLANLVYPEMTQSIVTVTPGVQISAARQLSNGVVVSGFARGAVTMSPFADSWTALTQFAAAPEGLPPIEIIEPFDAARLGLDLGLSIGCEASGLRMHINYGGNFGLSTVEHTVKGGLNYRFDSATSKSC